MSVVWNLTSCPVPNFPGSSRTHLDKQTADTKDMALDIACTTYDPISLCGIRPPPSSPPIAIAAPTLLTF